MNPLKKVLFITYYWPPSGGAGIQRPVKLAKYLPQFGIEPIVLTVDPAKASYAIRDESFAHEIAAQLQVKHTNTREFFHWYGRLTGKKQIPAAGFANDANPGLLQKFGRFLRGNFFIPDARVGWVDYAVQEAEQLIREQGIDTILITSPPHSSQLIGLKLKKKFPQLKWVADLNDPWTDIYYYRQMYHTPVAKAIDAGYERKVLEQADRLVTVSHDFKRLFLEKSAEPLENKFVIIPNGFDEEDFQQTSVCPRDFFTITYTGTIGSIYKPELFLDALSLFLQKRSAAKVKVRFIGIVADDIKAYAKSQNLETCIEYHSPVPHRQSVALLLQSSALLLAVPFVKNNKGICPGKLFEYLAARKPVLCIGPADGDAANMLRHCEAGETFEDSTRLLQYLETLYERWEANPETTLTNSTEKVYAYERKNIARLMADVLLNSV